MVHEEKLSAVLSDFARTMATDFPIQGILDHLVQRIVDVLPVTAAGVTLIHDGEAPRYIAASNDEAMRYERLQTEIGEGPCLTAFVSGAGGLGTGPESRQPLRAVRTGGRGCRAGRSVHLPAASSRRATRCAGPLPGRAR